MLGAEDRRQAPARRLLCFFCGFLCGGLDVFGTVGESRTRGARSVPKTEQSDPLERILVKGD